MPGAPNRGFMPLAEPPVQVQTTNFSRGWLENSLQVFNFWEKISTSWFHHRTFPWWIFHDYPTNKGFFWHQRDDLKNHLPIIFWKNIPKWFLCPTFWIGNIPILGDIHLVLAENYQWFQCLSVINPNGPLAQIPMFAVENPIFLANFVD